MKKNSKYIGQVNPFWMLICEDNIYKIKNWNKYQSADKYELIKEQNRERQKRFRENQKNENNINVTLGNGTEENKKENNKLEESKKDFSKKKGLLKLWPKRLFKFWLG